MAGKGKAPTPTKILKARGSKLVKGRAGEPEFTEGAGDCPASLKGEAKREWGRITRELDRVGILQQTDRALLAAYCEAWGEFVQYVEAGLEVGRDEAIRRGYLKAKNAAADRLRRLAEQFGFSPAARTRVRVTEDKADDTEALRYFDGAALG